MKIENITNYVLFTINTNIIMDHNVVTIQQVNNIKIMFDNILDDVNKLIDSKLHETVSTIKQSVSDGIKHEIINNVNTNIFPEMYSKNYRKIDEEGYYKCIYDYYSKFIYSNDGVNRDQQLLICVKHDFPSYNKLCDEDEYIIKVYIISKIMGHYQDGNDRFNKVDQHIYIITNKLKCLLLKVHINSKFINVSSSQLRVRFADDLFQISIHLVKTGKFYTPNDYIDIVIELLERELHEYRHSEQYCRYTTGSVEYLNIPNILVTIENCIEKYLTNRTIDTSNDTSCKPLLVLQRKYQGYSTYHERYGQYVVNCKEFEKIKNKFNTESGVKEFEDEKRKLSTKIEHYKNETGLKELNDAQTAYGTMKSDYIIMKNKYDRQLEEFNRKKELFEKAKQSFEAQINDVSSDDNHDD